MCKPHPTTLMPCLQQHLPEALTIHQIRVYTDIVLGRRSALQRRVVSCRRPYASDRRNDGTSLEAL